MKIFDCSVFDSLAFEDFVFCIYFSYYSAIVTTMMVSHTE